MERDTIICRCLNVTYGQIEDAVEQGCDTYQKVNQKVRFGVGCGGCRARIKQLIYQLSYEAKKKNEQ